MCFLVEVWSGRGGRRVSVPVPVRNVLRIENRNVRLRKLKRARKQGNTYSEESLFCARLCLWKNNLARLLTEPSLSPKEDPTDVENRPDEDFPPLEPSLSREERSKRPSPQVVSHDRYISVASRPKPKKQNTASPTPIWTQRSKTTAPFVGTSMISFQLGPWTADQENGWRAKSRLRAKT